MSLIDFRFIQRLFNPTPVDLPIASDDRVDTALEKLQGQIDTLKIENAYRLSGFGDRVQSRLSFNPATRVLTVEPNTPSFSSYVVYINDRRVIKTSPESIQIPNTNGLHFIYFNQFSSALEVSQTFFDAIITEHTFVSVIYWNTFLQRHIYFGDERHGIMDPESHLHFHQSFGARYISGLALGGFTIGDGSLNSHSQFFVEGGIIRDEDIKHVILDDSPQDLNPIAKIPVFYRLDNNVWYSTIATDTPLLLNGQNGYTGILPAYNYFDTTWKISSVPNNDYLLIHILATNDINNPIIALLGNKYSTIADARENSKTEFSTLTGLPFVEFVLIATVIYHVKDTFTNIPKAAIVTTADGFNYVDWREQTVFSGINSNGSSSIAGDFPLFIQDNQPSYPDKYFWVQTNVNGDPTKFTVFFNK